MVLGLVPPELEINHGAEDVSPTGEPASARGALDLLVPPGTWLGDGIRCSRIPGITMGFMVVPHATTVVRVLHFLWCMVAHALVVQVMDRLNSWLSLTALCLVTFGNH